MSAEEKIDLSNACCSTAWNSSNNWRTFSFQEITVLKKGYRPPQSWWKYAASMLMSLRLFMPEKIAVFASLLTPVKRAKWMYSSSDLNGRVISRIKKSWIKWLVRLGPFLLI